MGGPGGGTPCPSYGGWNPLCPPFFLSLLYMPFAFSYGTQPFFLPTGSTIDISRVILSTPEPVPVTYLISPNLPDGLAITPSNGNITGYTTFSSISPSRTYTVDASGATVRVSATLTLSVNFTPAFSYPRSPSLFLLNQFLTIQPSYLIANLDTIFYTDISPTPLAQLGLSLDPLFGVISGVPDISSNLTTYYIRANNAGVIFDASLNISIQTAPTIAYPEAIYILTQNTPVSILPLASQSQTEVSYTLIGCSSSSLSYNLPFGLTFNTATGEISGLPSVPTTFQEYTVSITNSIGTASTFLNLNVIKEILAPPVVADNFSSDTFLSNPDIAMRRKAEIFKYKKNSANLTKQQQYALLAQGNGPSAKRAWGTQGDAYTNPNTNNLPLVGNTFVCNTNTIVCSPTSSSDVPGPVMNLCYNPAVPLIGYNQPNRFRTNIGFKWPLRSWQPGDNGFPIGKAGSG